VLEFVPYLTGSFSWRHLWYIIYIYVNSLICIPMLLFFKSRRSNLFKAKASIFFSKAGRLFLLGAPLLLSFYALAACFPITHDLINDWYNYSNSLVLFVILNRNSLGQGRATRAYPSERISRSEVPRSAGRTRMSKSFCRMQSAPGMPASKACSFSRAYGMPPPVQGLEKPHHLIRAALMAPANRQMLPFHSGSVRIGADLETGQP
jgi:hypothetical protein